MNFRCAVSRAVLSIGLWLSVVGACQAATFYLTYDDYVDQNIGTSTIIGNGIFSFSGPAAIGNYALSSLSDLMFSAAIGSVSFTTADIYSNPNLTGISIFDRGAGEYGLVFTGSTIVVIPFEFYTREAFSLRNGSFDLVHEPTNNLNTPVGCCFGDGVTNSYFLYNSSNQEYSYFGDYSATTASPAPTPTPTPTSLALLTLGLLGLTQSKRHAAA